MPDSILLSFDGIHQSIAKANFSKEQISIISSRGLTGEVITDAVLIAFCTSTITAIAKIIIESIRQRKHPIFKYKGKEICFETNDIDYKEVIAILEKLLPKEEIE